MPSDRDARAEMSLGGAGQSRAFASIHRSPSRLAAATHPYPGPDSPVNSVGTTCHQSYPDATTGPSMTKRSDPLGNAGVYFTDASMTDGLERTRTPSTTTVAPVPAPSPACALEPGVALASGVGLAGVAVAEGSAVEGRADPDAPAGSVAPEGGASAGLVGEPHEVTSRMDTRNDAGNRIGTPTDVATGEAALTS